MKIERDRFAGSENKIIDLSNDECLTLIKALQHYQSDFYNDAASKMLSQLEEHFPLSQPGEKQLPIFMEY